MFQHYSFIYGGVWSLIMRSKYIIQHRTRVQQINHATCCLDLVWSFFTSHWLTLTRGLEAEGLEAPSERGGVDDINTVLTLAPSVKSDSDDQKHNCHHPCSKAWIQGHITAVLHTLKVRVSKREKYTFGQLFFFCFLSELHLIRKRGNILSQNKLKNCCWEVQLNLSCRSFFYKRQLYLQTTLLPSLFSVSHLPFMHSFIVPYWSVKATNEEPQKEGDYNQPSTWLSFQTLLSTSVGGILCSTGIMWQNQFIKLAHRQQLCFIWSHKYNSI